MDNQENSFWKHNHKSAVPGRPSPKKIINKSPAGKANWMSYQNSVKDAWDFGDDEFCILSERHGQVTSSNKQHKTIGVHKSSSAGTSHSNYVNNNLSNSTSNNTQIPTIKMPYIQEEHQLSTKDLQQQKSQLASGGTDDIEESTTSSNSNIEYGKLRQRFHSYPGRPQLLKFSAMCLKDDAESKLDKFTATLEAEMLNLKTLKELSWSGIPRKKRAITWRLLSGYLPTSLERRNPTLERKRIDYHSLVKQYFHVDSRDESAQDTFRQIHIDVPRMNPHVPLFQQKTVQEMFERILFIWAIRHPASGYVQGMNDLVTPFFIVFLQEGCGAEKAPETCRLEELAMEMRDNIEADSFWCLSKFLDCIQDNYIFAQLGIQAKVNQLKELVQRIDVTLHNHLHSNGVDYLQFSFRWMNNLLTRELPLYCTIRLWDTYLSDDFAELQIYVCAAFLLHWREQLLQENDFQGLMLLLQNLPTHNWTDSHIGVLVAEAFRLKFIFADCKKHLEVKS